MHSKHPFLRSYPGDTVSITGMCDTVIVVCGLECYSLLRLTVMLHGVFHDCNDSEDFPVDVVFLTLRLAFDVFILAFDHAD